MKVYSLIAALTLTGVSSVSAQSPAPSPSATPVLIQHGEIVPLWLDGKMPGMGAPKPETGELSPKDHVLRISNVSKPTLEIFKAHAAGGPEPAMIICPGGGYGELAYNLEGTEIASWLNSLGITGIVLKYRVPKNMDGAFQDVERAMRMARAHAADWGIEPNKVGVIGFSAGGHLSARLSNNFDDAAYPEIDSVDKQSCRPDYAILVYPAYLEVSGALAPEMKLPANLPPTLIVHNEDDHKFAPGSKLYDAALTRAKLPHEFLFYQTGGHGYGLRSRKAVKAWPADAAKWLQQNGVIKAS